MHVLRACSFFIWENKPITELEWGNPWRRLLWSCTRVRQLPATGHSRVNARRRTLSHSPLFIGHPPTTSQDRGLIQPQSDNLATIIFFWLSLIESHGNLLPENIFGWDFGPWRKGQKSCIMAWQTKSWRWILVIFALFCLRSTKSVKDGILHDICQKKFTH